MRSFQILFAIAVVVFSGTLQAQGGDRVALVIGNSNYEEGRLQNPTNDADAIEGALSKLGFTVIKKKDADLSQMEDALLAFRRSLGKGSLGLFFYAGHGVQVKGENFLVPIGAKLREEYEVTRQCLEVGQVLNAMNEAESNLKVMVLDCCRNNPFQRSWSRNTGGGGLAAISDIPTGTIITFSTTPGKTAADGTGNNSPFTEQLVASMKSRPQGGLELTEVFREASRNVKRATANVQIPWLNMEASLEKYYLWENGTPPTPSKTQPPLFNFADVDRSETEARSSQQAWADYLGQEVSLTNSLGMQFRLLPPGEFMMGSVETTEDLVRMGIAIAEGFKPSDEQPQHQVQLSQPFYMGVHEVTLGQFLKYYDADKLNHKTDAEKDGQGGWGYDGTTMEQKVFYAAWNSGWNKPVEKFMDHPVVNISWNDSISFCGWLTKMERSSGRIGMNQEYALPSEAQWEYACRGGSKTKLFSYGNDPEQIVQYGNIKDASYAMKLNGALGDTNGGNDGHVFTSPVGQYRGNGFGLHDMHGNVWEWCLDNNARYQNRTIPVKDPIISTGGSRRLLRGGGWGSAPVGCRSAYRDGESPEFRSDSLGLRVVLQSVR